MHSSRIIGDLKHTRRETRRHLAVQADLDSGLNLVLSLDKSIEKLVGVNHCLAVVRHKADYRGVPFVDDLREGG